MMIRVFIGAGFDSEVTTLQAFLSENEDFIDAKEALAIEAKLESSFEAQALDCCKLVRIC